MDRLVCAQLIARIQQQERRQFAQQQLGIAMMVEYSQSWTALAVVGLSVVAITAVFVPLWNVCSTFLLEPLRLRRVMGKQDVRLAPFNLVFGNAFEIGAHAQSFPETLPLKFDDLEPTATPQFDLYFSKYGKRFLYHVGSETRLVVRDPEMAKEVLFNRMGWYERSPLDLHIFSQVIGKGMFVVKGEEWEMQRRMLNPCFSNESLKPMVERMVKSAAQEMRNWEEMAAQAGGRVEHDVEHDIHIIAYNIISYTAFNEGFDKGKQIYLMQDEIMGHLFAAIGNPSFWIPGLRLLPTKHATAIAQLNGRTEKLIMELVKDRREAVQKGERDSYGDDLLGRMLTATERTDGSSHKFILDAVINNCKNFFFAGSDSAANLTTFSLLMLANYPEWQDRARKEVLEVFGDNDPCEMNDISRLKIVGMISQEIARIFAVSPSIARLAVKDCQLGDLFIPKGLVIEIATLAMHRDPELWGKDVAEFRPERFANGASAACTHHQAFLPFGAGPRSCIAEKMAWLEVKVVLCMILRRFLILPSPKYKHHPHFAMVNRPKYGLPLILEILPQSRSDSIMAEI